MISVRRAPSIVTRSMNARIAWALFAGMFAAAIFWMRGSDYLYRRHPHEDAFILFRYAEHLARGHGIVLNIGGPHAEGATDFLFMVALAGFVRLGVDVAVAAVWLNAASVGLLAFLLSRLWSHYRLAGAHASYDGFGTEL